MSVLSAKDILSQQVQTLEKHLKDWNDQIKENIKSSGQQATGKTASSFMVVMNDSGGKIEANRFYKVLETGRKPGKMPPPSALYDWLQVRFPSVFMTSKGNEVQSLAYIIARKIGKEGSALFRAGGRKDIYSNVLTDSEIEKLTVEIGDNVFTDVYNNINVIVK